MEIVTASLEIIRRLMQKIGPYVVAFLLPGGALLAVMLYFYRRRKTA